MSKTNLVCILTVLFDISNTICHAEVENGALLHNVARSWKMIIGGHGKVFENF